LSSLRNAAPRRVSFLGQEGVPVAEAGQRERQEGAHPQAHRPQDGVQEIEVVVQEALATGMDQPVVRVLAGRRVARRVRDEGAPRLHARQQAVNPLSRGVPPVVQDDHLLLAPARGRRDDRDGLLGRVPGLGGPVRRRAAQQHLGRHAGNPDHLPEEVDEVLRALQPLEVPVEDDPVPRGAAELDVRPQQLRQSLHGCPPLARRRRGTTTVLAPTGSRPLPPDRGRGPSAAFRFTWLGLGGRARRHASTWGGSP
jgi:hypothetical protein